MTVTLPRSLVLFKAPLCSTYTQTHNNRKPGTQWHVAYHVNIVSGTARSLCNLATRCDILTSETMIVKLEELRNDKKFFASYVCHKCLQKVVDI
jgi:hypothetical protein